MLKIPLLIDVTQVAAGLFKKEIKDNTKMGIEEGSRSAKVTGTKSIGGVVRDSEEPVSKKKADIDKPSRGGGLNLGGLMSGLGGLAKGIGLFMGAVALFSGAITFLFSFTSVFADFQILTNNITNILTIFTQQLGAIFLPVATQLLGGLTGFLQGGFLTGVAKVFQALIPVLQYTLSELFSALNSIDFESIASAIAVGIGMLQPLLNAAIGIAKVFMNISMSIFKATVSFLTSAYNFFAGIGEYLNISKYAAPFWDNIVFYFTEIGNFFSGNPSYFGRFSLGKLLSGIGSAFQKAIAGIWEGIKFGAGFIANLGSAIGEGFMIGFNWLKNSFYALGDILYSIMPSWLKSALSYIGIKPDEKEKQVSNSSTTSSQITSASSVNMNTNKNIKETTNNVTNNVSISLPNATEPQETARAVMQEINKPTLDIKRTLDTGV